jgi:hypothetical protein
MPANIGNFLSDASSWSESEKWVIKWQFGLLGDFQKALASAIIRADDSNLAKLEIGFPMQVKGFREWADGNLARLLRDAGLDI